MGPETLGATSSHLSQLQGTLHPPVTPGWTFGVTAWSQAKPVPAAEIVYTAIKSPLPSDER